MIEKTDKQEYMACLPALYFSFILRIPITVSLSRFYFTIILPVNIILLLADVML